MAELPKDLRATLVAARVAYTPGSERLDRIEQRLQAALLSGASPSVPSDVAQAQRFVGIESGKPWYLKLSKTFLSTLALGFVTIFVIVLSQHNPPQATPLDEGERSQQPALAPIGEAPIAQLERDASRAQTTRAPTTEPPSLPSLQPVTKIPSPSIAPARSAHRESMDPSMSTKATSAREAPRPASPQPPQTAFGKAPTLARHLGSSGPGMTSTSSRDARSAGGDRLSQEVRIVEAARKALESGDIAKAEATLRQHRKEFPGGQLVSERTALETRARCVAGDRAAARKLFQELKLRTPKSSLKRAVERACGDLLLP